MLQDISIRQEVVINFNLAQDIVNYLYRSASFQRSEFYSVKCEFSIIVESLAPSKKS